MSSSIKPTSGSWLPEPPASEEQIQMAEKLLELSFPESYRKFLKESNGGSGGLPTDPGFLEFWPCDQLKTHNDGYRVREWLPGFFGIGSSGTGEMFAFRIEDHPWPIYRLQFSPLDPHDAILVAPSFDELLAMIGKDPWNPESEATSKGLSPDAPPVS